MQPQPKLGLFGLMAMLVLASVIMPLSFDMYTPAIPGMPEHFGTDAATVNLTLVSYFVFFAVGVIVFGPLSDRTGRRPVLLMGSVAYALGSAACALAPTVHALIGARVVQALGGGALSSVCTAVTKDSFESAYRERVLSVVQVLFVAGPTLAPLLGAAIVTIADWRVSFWVLAAVGALFCVLAACFRETLPEGCRKTAGPGRGLVRLAGLAKDPGFMVFAVIGSMFRLPFMGCIAVGSYIYIETFGLSEAGFGAFSSVAALLMAAGPMIWMAASKRVSVIRFTTISFAVALSAGCAMLLIGRLSAVLYFACFVAFSLAECCTKPYMTNILLEQQKLDAGSASALMSCIRTLSGTVGMALAALPWCDYVTGVGILMVASMAAALAGWVFLLGSRIPLACIKGSRPIRPFRTRR